MNEAIGRRRRAIAEGFIPGESHGPAPEMTSHEALCILSCGKRDAHVRITIFREDRDPVGPYQLLVPARRTRHFRLNDLTDPEPIPRDSPYSSVIEADVPVVVDPPAARGRRIRQNASVLVVSS